MLYPPHLTHALQPLDVCLFGPLAAAYSKELELFLIKSMALLAITKRDFFRLFDRAWKALFRPDTIKLGFEKCGIYPFNPDPILDRFSQLDQDRPSSSDLLTLVLTAEDWRRIEKLLNKVASDMTSK